MEKHALFSVTKKNFVLRLVKYLRPYSGHIALLFTLTLFASLLSILPPLVLQYAIDNFLAAGNILGLLFITVAILSIGLLSALQNYMDRRISQFVGLNVVKNIRNELFDHISHQPFEFFDKTSTGDIVARVTSDTDQLSHFLNQSIIQFVVNVFMLIGILVVMFLWDYRFGLIYCFIFPFILVGMYFFTKKVLPAHQRTRKSNSALTSSIQECFNGIREVKLYGREEFMHATFKKWNDEYYSSIVDANTISSVWNPFISNFLNIFSVFSIMLGGYLILATSSSFSMGQLIAAYTYFGMLGGPIQAITGFSNTYNTAKAATERVLEIMDKLPTIHDLPNAIPLNHVNGEIEFDNVSFGYDPAQLILKNISLKLNPGEIIALVGPSGVGKTTLAHLVPRFYDVSAGIVKIDGNDIRNYQLASLRKNVGIVMQNVFLFDGSIAQNIAYGKEHATLDEIRSAAKIAQLDEFIQTLPDGYNTPIGERGVRLSGGQAQRLSIARVLLTDPKILILDEPTANVDAITDYNLIHSVEAVMKGRTTIIIAHRLWTIKNANKIVVLRNGIIDSVGSHDALLASSPFYKEFFATQFEEVRFS